jgi:Thiamine pyrophosphate-requiring enzymes [acetolactate synthase, pyruvate dehydrogenase (cytochrome), glyoxylate carboligase, phosphonopyruvate decarboxylase]
MNTHQISVAADAVINFLIHKGINGFHNYPGGTIAPLLDACNRFGLPVYTSRHEQGAGYAALAQARLSLLPGVVAVTSGPGVTNLLTAIADAYFDSVPMLVLTGQVGTGDLPNGRTIRQSGFQQVDTPALMKPLTKAQFQPRSAEELSDILPQAWEIALSGRKGPVAIDLPMDVQRTPWSSPFVCSVSSTHSLPVSIPEGATGQFLNALLKAICTAQHPVIICGSGMVDCELVHQLSEIRKLWPAPVSQSLPGVGVVDSQDMGSLGFHGHTGSQLAGKAIAEADLLLVLGSRLDIRQTGTLKEQFASKAQIFRIDFDEHELMYTRIQHHHALCAKLQDVLPMMKSMLNDSVTSIPQLTAWSEQIAIWRKNYAWDYPEYPGISPIDVISQLSDAIQEKVIVTTGVGAHQHWVARHFRFSIPERKLFTSSGHGAMGYDLPTAIGAAIHAPDTKVICVAGDGSVQMNIQELGVLAELGLNVKVLILDNHRLALVSQFQLMNWENDIACGNKLSPDFVTIAKGYGIKGFYCDTPEQLHEVLPQFINSAGPSLLHVVIDSRHDVLPMLLGGQSMDKMWPYFDMQGTPRELKNA